ncbi:pantoate--beta-alanine ligase [Radiobacillus sp. PE A8.2]|uniref:pantoate--beta-alanine ligase n=1 Tax=Radiobacillus sp. PE A8.2 TaxID=3380349 RepID=UPI0038911750
MKIIRSIREMQQYANELKMSGKSIGFVPTMGFLHEGHESLMKRAKTNNDIVIVSIFVNPLQFGPNEDFDRYPRDEEHDILVAQKNNIDILFIPQVEEMYPNDRSITMDITKRTDVLCGRSRVGHFAGVITVLTKLFHLTLPSQAYFGLKDAQQFAVVDALVNDLNFPIELVPVTTVREQDGLAKSSRNVYLSEPERQEATALYQGLQFGRQLVETGTRDPDYIVNEVERFINSQTRGKIDYVELLSYPDLTPVDEVNEQVILAVAVFYEHARLIDNLIFDQNGKLTLDR